LLTHWKQDEVGEPGAPQRRHRRVHLVEVRHPEWTG
jgi:hypothetical protein